jgi:hypothetical protein
MTKQAYSTFFWKDWLADTSLRACSYGARSLWIDMLAICAQATPPGYLFIGAQPVTPKQLSRICGMSEATTQKFLKELESRGVFARDLGGNIYSRRMVREVKQREQGKANGHKGGNPTLCNSTTFSEKGLTPQGYPPPITGGQPEGVKLNIQYPISNIQPKGAGSGSASPAMDLYTRLVEVTGIDLIRYRRHPGWLQLPGLFHAWSSAGAEPEKDIWPTIARLIAQRSGDIPAGPNYFTRAIMEAKENRLSGKVLPMRKKPTLPEREWDDFDWERVVDCWNDKGWWIGKGKPPCEKDTGLPEKFHRLLKHRNQPVPIPRPGQPAN